MTQNDDVAGSPDRDVTPPETPAEHPVADEPAAAAPVAAAPVLKTRWRDRAWSFRAMLAVALATFVIGGIGGGVVGAAAGHEHRHDRFSRMGPGGPGMGMHPGWRRHEGRWNGGGPWWNQGPQQPQPTPYGGPSSSAPTPSPASPGATG